jgi:putative dimethyl sulfoxide reductase chaperone
MPQETTREKEAGADELCAVMRQRADTYALLSRLYAKEVDEELLERLLAMRFPASTGNAKVDAGYELIAGYLSGAWENTVTELSVDYVRTFIGHGVDAYCAAYPFESVYTSEKRLMMQNARDEVLAIYRSEGMDKSTDWKDAEDHVAMELEFQGELARRCAERLADGDEDGAAALVRTQKNFMHDHLASWVPMMTADMDVFARTDFYRGLARLTEGFLETDGEFLAEILQGQEG